MELSPRWKQYLSLDPERTYHQAQSLLSSDLVPGRRLSEDFGSVASADHVRMADNVDALLHVERPVQSLSVQDRSPVAFSPDGQLVAYVNGTRGISLLQLEQGAFQPIETLEGHHGGVRVLLFHPTKPNVLISGGQDGIVAWDIIEKLPCVYIPTRSLPQLAAFSSAAAVLPATDGHDGDVESMLWCYDGSTLITGGKDALIKAWDWSCSPPRLLETVTGHKSAVLALAFHGPSAKLASAGRDSTIKVWDVSTLSMDWRARRSDDSGITVGLLANLDGHRGDVTSLCWAGQAGPGQAADQPATPILLSGARDNRVLAWSSTTWTELREIKDSIMAGRGVRSQHHSDVKRLGLLPDGLHALSASTDGTIKIWRLGQTEAPSATPRAAAAAGTAATGDLLGIGAAIAPAAAGAGGAAVVPESEDDTARTLLDEILGTTAASTGLKGVAGAAVGNDALLATVTVTGDAELGVNDLAVNPTRPIVAVSSAAHSVTLYALRPDVLPWLSRIREGPLPQGAIPPGTDLTPLVPVQGFHGHSSTVSAIALSADDTSLYSCSVDQTVSQYDVRSGSRRAQHAHGAAALCIAAQTTADGKLGGFVFVGGADYLIRAYAADSAAYAPIKDAYARLPTPRSPPAYEYECARYVGHAGRVDSVALHPDGGIMVSGARDFTICVWSLTSPAPTVTRGPPRDNDDVPTIAPLSRLAAHKGHVTGLSFSHAALGGLLASCGSDHLLQVWRVNSGGSLSNLWKSGSAAGGSHSSAVSCVVWGRPTTVAATANDTTVAGISDVRELLYSAGWDGMIKVWSGRNPAKAPIVGANGAATLMGGTEVVPLRTLAGHKARVSALAVSSDGTMLVSASADRTARVWSIRAGQQCVAVYHPSVSDGPLASVSAGLNLFATGGDAGISLWPLKPTGQFASYFSRAAAGTDGAGVAAPAVTAVPAGSRAGAQASALSLREPTGVAGTAGYGAPNAMVSPSGSSVTASTANGAMVGINVAPVRGPPGMISPQSSAASGLGLTAGAVNADRLVDPAAAVPLLSGH